MLLSERLGSWGQVASEFAWGLRERQHRYLGPDLQRILRLQIQWSVDDILKAMEHAIGYDAYDARAIDRILAARFNPQQLSEQLADSTRGRIRDLMRDYPVTQRPLASYEVLRKGDSRLYDQEDSDADAQRGKALS